MIRSVSMSLPLMETAVPLTWVIFTISLMWSLLKILAHVHNLAIKRRRRNHRGAHEQCPPLRAALPANEIAIRRRGRNLPPRKFVRIHRQTHGASRFTPLESSLREDFVQPLLLCELLHFRRAGNYQRANPGLHFPAFGNFRCGTQICETAICA